jgi:hypothetical protein
LSLAFSAVPIDVRPVMVTTAISAATPNVCYRAPAGVADELQVKFIDAMERGGIKPISHAALLS